MNKEELLECLKNLSTTNNKRDGIEIKREEAQLIIEIINKQKEVLDKIKEYCNHKLEMLELQKRNIMQILTPENGYLKTNIEIEMQKYKDILELLEEIE